MKKKIFLRIASLLLALISGFHFISGIAAWLISDVFGGISFNITRASTVGIIGGADGPTAIFVTATHPHLWEMILWFLLFAVSLYGLRRFRKQ